MSLIKKFKDYFGKKEDKVKGTEEQLFKMKDDILYYFQSLIDETNAKVVFSQSDEISLIVYSDDRKSSIYNDGKKQKILSKLTAKCTMFFNERRKLYLPEHNKNAIFDCRIYQTPTLHDACLQLLWRENDYSISPSPLPSSWIK